MIDFKDSKVFENKSKEMEDFLNQVLIKKSERGKEEEEESHENEDGEGTIAEAEMEEFLGISGDVEKEDDLKDFADNLNKREEGRRGLEAKEEEKKRKTTFFKTEEELEEEKPYETGEWWKNLLVAPYFLIYFMIRSLGVRMQEKENIHLYLNKLTVVSGIVTASTLVLLFLTDFRFIFSLTVQAIVSGVMFVISFIMVKLINQDGIMDYLRHRDLHEDGEDTASLDVEETEDGIFEEMETEEVGEVDKGEDRKEEDMSEEDIDKYLEGDMEDLENVSEDNAEVLDKEEKAFDTSKIHDDIFGDEDIEEDEKSDDVEVRQMSEVVGKRSPIGESPIDVNVELDEFLKQMRRVYEKNEKYRGVRLDKRADLVQSFSEYVISNDPEFSVWYELEEDSYEYENLFFALYNGIVGVNNRFKNMGDDNVFIKVNDIVQNPLMYKVEVELPEYIDAPSLNSKMEKFGSAFKSDEGDTEVMISVGSFQHSIVFRIFKSSKGMISLGDVLRYHNDAQKGEQSYEYFMSDKYELPIVLGLRGNEFPTYVDFADNTSLLIAGESGSGKSWGTFLVMLNLILTNDYHDMNLVIMDIKKSMFWRELSKLPHTVGYHTDFQDYFEVLKELNEEMDRRKSLLAEADEEDWKGLRKSLRKRGKYGALKGFPWLVIAVDEMTNTMEAVEQLSNQDEEFKHIYKTFIGNLARLSQEGRSLGIKLISIGQRVVQASIPKNVTANSSFKMLFNLPVDDYGRANISESDLKTLQLPRMKGQAIVQDQETVAKPQLLKTLTLGGIDNDQIANLIRALVFDWKRRSEGDKLQYYPTLEFTMNRDKIQEKLEKDMEEGDIFVVPGEEEESKAEKVARMNLEGIDIRDVSDSNQLSFEKEDENGNVVSEEKKEKPKSVKIDMGEGIEVGSGKKKERNEGKREEERNDGDSREEENEEMLTKKVEMGGEVKVEKKKEKDPFEELDQIGRGSKSRKRDVKGNAGKVAKKNREKKLKGRKESLEELKKQRKKVIEGDWGSKDSGKKDNEGMSVREYVKSYGKGDLTKQVPKHVIEERFTKKEIEDSLSNGEVFKQGTSYLA